MSENKRQFAVCTRNDGYEESLEPRKIYEIIEDATASEHGMIRVIDEEDEDYLYPRDWFLPIQLPDTIEQAVLELTHRSSAA
jgi:hypothetical protein